mmetsp:Transcript_12052/g.25328  ORF Transcript_12052/g.25328 Transcript_12052/m.25328 type:complete len:218 (+) Transcript_12052:628-1281(+)
MSLLSTSIMRSSLFLSSSGNLEKSRYRTASRNSPMGGKSASGSRYSNRTLANSSSRLSRRFSCAFCLFSTRGICFLRWLRRSAWMRAVRMRFTSSFTLRLAARRGTLCRSSTRSSCSRKNSFSPYSFRSRLKGAELNDPTYTLGTSGLSNTFLKDHISAPYTRISCCASTWSALFRTTLTLSSYGRSAEITWLNSSLMSSLWGSKSSSITSLRAANH